MNTLINDIITEAETPIIAMLIWASLVDLIIGVFKAFYCGKFNSTISTAGIIKHITMVTLPILIHPVFNMITGGEQYYNAVVLLLILTMLSSILENYAEMGLPYPSLLNKIIDDEKLKVDPELVKNETSTTTPSATGVSAPIVPSDKGVSNTNAPSDKQSDINKVDDK